MGAYDEAHWQTVVAELKANIGVLLRGTILATGTAGDIGKLVPAHRRNRSAVLWRFVGAQAVDTAAPFTDGSVTGSITAKAGSFKGSP